MFSRHDSRDLNSLQSFSTVSPISGDPEALSLGEGLENLGGDGKKEIDFDARVQREEQGLERLHSVERDYDHFNGAASRDELNDQQNNFTSIQQENLQEWTSLEARRNIGSGSGPSSTIVEIGRASCRERV